MIERTTSAEPWMTTRRATFDIASFHAPERMEGKTSMHRVMAMLQLGTRRSYSNEARCRAGAGPNAAGSVGMHDARHPDASGA